jgi:hypothetical protein
MTFPGCKQASPHRIPVLQSGACDLCLECTQVKSQVETSCPAENTSNDVVFITYYIICTSPAGPYILMSAFSLKLTSVYAALHLERSSHYSRPLNKRNSTQATLLQRTCKTANSINPAQPASSDGVSRHLYAKRARRLSALESFSDRFPEETRFFWFIRTGSLFTRSLFHGLSLFLYPKQNIRLSLRPVSRPRNRHCCWNLLSFPCLLAVRTIQ